MSTRAHVHQSAAARRRQDLATVASRGEPPLTRTEFLLTRIERRSAVDAPPLDASHVLRLAQSIAVLGLLEPLVVDRRGRLIAGGHRLAALRLLDERVPHLRGAMLTALLKAAGKPLSTQHLLAASALLPGIPGTEPHPMLAAHPSWPLVPVRQVDIDAERQPAQAFAAAAAEPTQRHTYSREEVRHLADRLREAGFIQRTGRPRPGERRLLTALAAIVGRPAREISTLLSDAIAPEPAMRTVPAADHRWSRLTRDAAVVKATLAGTRSAAATRVRWAIDELTAAIDALVENRDAGT